MVKNTGDNIGRETTINNDIQASKTQVNNATVNSEEFSSTIVNSALYNLSQIPVGTILCDKYKVISELNIMSGEASLFICECNGEKYVAKLYRRDVAIKDDVTNALKNISSPHVAKLFDTGIYNGLPFEIIPFYAQGSLQGRIGAIIKAIADRPSKSNTSQVSNSQPVSQQPSTRSVSPSAPRTTPVVNEDKHCLKRTSRFCNCGWKVTR